MGGAAACDNEPEKYQLAEARQPRHDGKRSEVTAGGHFGMHANIRSISWWLGDWRAYGEARYGERKAIVEAEDWEGPGYETCRAAARVSRDFEMCRRRMNSSERRLGFW
jgi:hypothetical protein